MSRDEPLLLDMLHAAVQASTFVVDLDQSQFAASELHQNAVIRSLEVIGEAASRVSPSFRDAHPDIPWRDIIGMRNRLIHNYSNVSLDTVWDVVRFRLTTLVAALELLIPPDVAPETP
jgi:uncharacterized protein with HEPN domain